MPRTLRRSPRSRRRGRLRGCASVTSGPRAAPSARRSRCAACAAPAAPSPSSWTLARCSRPTSCARPLRRTPRLPRAPAPRRRGPARNLVPARAWHHLERHACARSRAALGAAAPQRRDVTARHRLGLRSDLQRGRERRSGSARAVLCTSSAAAGIDGHVLVIDDGSPDGTGAHRRRAQRAGEPRLHVLHRRSKDGIGPAYLAGFALRARRSGADLVDRDGLRLLPRPGVPAAPRRGRRRTPTSCSARATSTGGQRRGLAARRGGLISRAGCWYAQTWPGRRRARPDGRLQVLPTSRRCSRSCSTTTSRQRRLRLPDRDHVPGPARRVTPCIEVPIAFRDRVERRVEDVAGPSPSRPPSTIVSLRRLRRIAARRTGDR